MSNAHASALPRVRGRLRPEDRRRGNKLAWLIEHRAQLLASIAVSSLAVGGLLYALGEGAAGQMVWRVTVALLAAELAVEVGRTVVVEHSLGVDTIALVAMVGSLALGPGARGRRDRVDVLGRGIARGDRVTRARRELTALVQRAPKVAQLRVDDRLRGSPGRAGAGRATSWSSAPARSCQSTAPCSSAEAVVDTSTLSGEPLPVTVRRGMPVLSGSANAGAAVRCPRRPARGRQRVRGAGATGRAGPDPARSVRADGRPLRRVLSSRDAAGGRAWRGP